jgi:DNA polymerase III gamma/tau subunit
MDLLSKLSQGAGEDRKYAFDLFESFLTSERSQLFSQFSEFAKEKEKTLELFEFFDQFLRDLWIPDPSQRIHVDLQGSYERLQHWDSTQIEKAWLEMQHTRKSIEMNGDRTLNLENLWFRLQEISA